MTRKEIVALFDRLQDATREADVATLTDLHAEDGVVESLMAGKIMGRAAIGKVYQAWFAAFPDVVSTTDALLIDRNRAALVSTMTGTDIGGFMGLSPTGKPFRLPMVRIYALENGCIQHERRIYDFTGLLVQIGVLKARPA